jgi:hypothetical protein
MVRVEIVYHTLLPHGNPSTPLRTGSLAVGTTEALKYTEDTEHRASVSSMSSAASVVLPPRKSHRRHCTPSVALVLSGGVAPLSRVHSLGMGDEPRSVVFPRHLTETDQSGEDLLLTLHHLSHLKKGNIRESPRLNESFQPFGTKDPPTEFIQAEDVHALQVFLVYIDPFSLYSWLVNFN